MWTVIDGVGVEEEARSRKNKEESTAIIWEDVGTAEQKKRKKPEMLKPKIFAIKKVYRPSSILRMKVYGSDPCNSEFQAEIQIPMMESSRDTYEKY